jgi:hypothetical protein
MTAFFHIIRSLVRVFTIIELLDEISFKSLTLPLSTLPVSKVHELNPVRTLTLISSVTSSIEAQSLYSYHRAMGFGSRQGQQIHSSLLYIVRTVLGFIIRRLPEANSLG